MERTIARMITLLGRKSQICIGNELRKYNITAAEQPLFMALQRHPGVTQEALTAIVCVDKAATARTVKSMEEKGYLTRMQDPQDRRQNRIYPTDAAKQIAHAVRDTLHHFNDLLTQGIDAQSLDIVSAALLKMEENLAALSEAAAQGGRENDANA